MFSKYRTDIIPTHIHYNSPEVRRVDFPDVIPVSRLLSCGDRARDPSACLLSHQWSPNGWMHMSLFWALNRSSSLDLRNLSNATVTKTRVCRWWVLCLINQHFRLTNSHWKKSQPAWLFTLYCKKRSHLLCASFELC